MKYKAGDKVRDTFTGKTGTIVKVDESDETYRVSGQRETGYWITEEDIAPVEKTLHTLEVGDVVVDKDREGRTVLEVLTNSCLLSDWHSQTKAMSWYTFKELEDYGYTIESPQPTPLKMTVKQIAEKLGHEVEIVK